MKQPGKSNHNNYKEEQTPCNMKSLFLKVSLILVKRFRLTGLETEGIGSGLWWHKQLHSTYPVITPYSHALCWTHEMFNHYAYCSLGHCWYHPEMLLPVSKPKLLPHSLFQDFSDNFRWYKCHHRNNCNKSRLSKRCIVNGKWGNAIQFNVSVCALLKQRLFWHQCH